MKFNAIFKRFRGGNVTNLAGGRAFAESPKSELVAILLTSQLEDQFYRSGQATVDRLKELIAAEPDKEFVAKAAVYARHEAGMRSVSHLVASELARSVKGEQWTRRFFEKVVRRPDDVLEILACHLAMYGRPIPNALKKGLGAALARFDEYQVAKYRRESAEIKLVDAVNLLHPPNSDALRKLVRDELAPAETWEVKLTQAGTAGANGQEAEELKAAAWAELIRSRKIGYFALLRNQRNILAQAPEVVDEVLSLLADETLIRKSLVLPFRYLTALEALEAGNLPRAGEVVEALSEAVDKSLANVPVFAGRTLVALDGSGSMQGQPLKIGALFASVLLKASSADMMIFSDDAKYLTVNRRDSTLTLAKVIESKAPGRGTNFHAVFEMANKAYDRIILLSDMQGWMGGAAPTAVFEKYKRRTGASPKVFSFDLQGYGTLQFPERDIFCLSGFSEKTLEMLKFLESDKSTLIRKIEDVQL
ncbi:MAG: hypothetical protein BGO12_12195 [Verrucomicrobia bacterium 61-8]|nr:TROVE domain-containing protein [Verrucomicrobiota bacterium]OJV15176.1 MAG: hypothetical protein BGO12_12195 [Verrucomicrobia bacterium 61-8]